MKKEKKKKEQKEDMMKGLPAATDPLALAHVCSFLQKKIEMTRKAMESVYSNLDPDEDAEEILIMNRASGKDLREDIDTLRKAQETLSAINAAKSTAPRDYHVSFKGIKIFDDVEGFRIVGEEGK